MWFAMAQMREDALIPEVSTVGFKNTRERVKQLVDMPSANFQKRTASELWYGTRLSRLRIILCMYT